MFPLAFYTQYKSFVNNAMTLKTIETKTICYVR